MRTVRANFVCQLVGCPTPYLALHREFFLSGCLNFKSLYLPDYSDPLPSAAAVESNLKYTSISKGASGQVVVSETVGSAKLLDVPAFSFAKKIINKEYFET